MIEVDSFRDLKGTSMLQKLESSVFWLDVFDFNAEIMSLLAKVFFFFLLLIHQASAWVTNVSNVFFFFFFF